MTTMITSGEDVVTLGRPVLPHHIHHPHHHPHHQHVVGQQPLHQTVLPTDYNDPKADMDGYGAMTHHAHHFDEDFDDHQQQQQQQQQQQHYYQQQQQFYNYQWQQQQQQQGHYGYDGYYMYPHQQQPGQVPPQPHLQQQPGQVPPPQQQPPFYNSHAHVSTPSPTCTNSDDSVADSIGEAKLYGGGGGGVGVGSGELYSASSAVAASQRALMAQQSAHHLQKRPRATRRSKKKRDPNEPQKPVSAYALFFRDMQAGIKSRNPNASFGDVSKHVASMWDNLDPDHKADYKKRTETAKKEYLRQLASYRANLVSKVSSGDSASHVYGGYGGYGAYMDGYHGPHAGHGPYARPNMMSPQSRLMGAAKEELERRTVAHGYPIPPQQHQQHALNHSPVGGVYNGGPESVSGGGASFVASGRCKRAGCNNPVTTDTGLASDGFCSNECVIAQSREVYNSWSSGGTGGPGGPGGAPAPPPPASSAPNAPSVNAGGPKGLVTTARPN